MKIATAVTTATGAGDRCAELVDQVRGALGARPVDLCLLFSSAHYEDQLESIAAGLHAALRPRAFIGTTAESVIADDVEYENRPALALWAAYLPDVRDVAFHFSQSDLGRFSSAESLRDHLGLSPGDEPSFLLLADPYSVNPLDVLDRLDGAFPGRPAIGGMASAADAPGQNVLVFDGQVLRNGVVGVALWGNLALETVVSQGCRPIGRHMVITRADRNIIYSLGGKPPLNVLHELLEEIPSRDQSLARRGLLVGRVIDEYKPSFARGDFLIRNLIGIDADTKAIAVNDLVRTGQTIQFHVRDEESASQDLDDLLAGGRGRAPAGALIFSCNGRGTRLFSERNHDAQAIATCFGRIPVAGAFCAGEIGPVGARNFLHGHTASIGLLRPRGGGPGA